MQTASEQAPPAAPPSLRFAALGELGVGGKLRENRIFSITETGIEFHGTPTKEQWREIVAGFLRIRDHFHLALADLIAIAEKEWGRAFVEEEIGQLQLPLYDAQRAIAICGLSRDVRHPALGVDHYWVLANKEFALDHEAQMKWSGLAVEHRLSPSALAASISAGRLLLPGQTANTRHRATIATPAGIAQAFELWRGQVDPAQLDHDAKIETLKQLRPIAAVVALLEAEVDREKVNIVTEVQRS